MSLDRISESALKRLVALQQKKRRREEGRFLVEGRRLVEEALGSPHRVEELVVEEGRETEFEAVLERARAAGVRLASAAAPKLARLADTVTPQGVVAVLAAREWTVSDVVGPGRAIAVLDGVSDPGNVGAILRSVWAFGLGGAILLPGTAERANPKTLRSSMGGGLHLPIVEDVSVSGAVQALRGASYHLVASSPRGGEPVGRAEWPARSAFLIGSEAAGLGAELDRAADRRVSIEQEPGTESLNAAVAAGILFHQHRIRGFRPVG